MKKFICTVLACGILTSAAAVYADEPMVIASAPTSSSYSVVIENNTLDLGGETVYELNKHMMVPLRTVAEKLGFKVKWDGECQGVSLDNGEVNTIVYIGQDNYYMASSTAIGMSAPTVLGVAPALKNGTTYVPADMFNILYCEDVVSVKDNVITIKTDNDNNEEEIVGMPNPFVEYKTVDEAQKVLPFSAVVPSNVKGYELKNVSVMSNEMLQLIYKNGDKEITYRVEKGSDDISGDYNEYKDIKTVKVGDVEVKVRKSEETMSTIWTNGDLTFSLYSNGNLTEKDITDIISSIK